MGMRSSAENGMYYVVDMFDRFYTNKNASIVFVMAYNVLTLGSVPYQTIDLMCMQIFWQ